MSRTWIPRADELSRERVAELQRFCWQYREKRARIAAKRGGVNGSSMESAGHGGVGRPTEQRAISVIDSKDYRDISMIEDAAREAADGCDALYACLIANVCDRVAFKSLAIPQGVNQFTATRRKFFWLLDKKR